MIIYRAGSSMLFVMSEVTTLIPMSEYPAPTRDRPSFSSIERANHHPPPLLTWVAAKAERGRGSRAYLVYYKTDVEL